MESNEYSRLISAIIVYLPSLKRRQLIDFFDSIKKESLTGMAEEEEKRNCIEEEHQVLLDGNLLAPAYIQALLKQYETNKNPSGESGSSALAPTPNYYYY